MMKYLKLDGSPKERGLEYGRKLKSNIWEGLERLRYESKVLGGDFDTIISSFLDQTEYMAAVKKWAPNLLVEVEGIAEGAEINFETMFAYQCLDEIARFLTKSNPLTTNECTTIGISKSGSQPTILGQNLDSDKTMRYAYQGLNSVLRIKYESGGESLVVANRPGLIGIVGMNNYGIGVVVNTINVQSSIDGLPLSFLIRSILEKTNLPDAIGFLKSVKIGAAQNLMLGDSTRVIDFECSANDVVEFSPYPNATRCYHSNHHLSNNDLIPGFDYPTERTNSQDRFDYLDFRMGNEKPFAFENMQGILRSHRTGICRHPEMDPSQSFTWFSVLYKLSDHPIMYVADGNPCQNPYKEFSFE